MNALDHNIITMNRKLWIFKLDQLENMSDVMDAECILMVNLFKLMIFFLQLNYMFHVLKYHSIVENYDRLGYITTQFTAST